MAEESFLIMRSLGVQVTTKMRFPLLSHSRFIPASQIDDVFLYEGFKGMEVRYYLAVVVHGEENVEVVFPVRTIRIRLIVEIVAQKGGAGTGLAEGSGGVI
jgi:phosphatidylinositol glycan class H protein